ncbi:hypothetical protein Vafri_19567 [Volvox africanus]|uniref:HotDog ACOT-type domain-containing protein n=1 Tax=Volvox africanus TaxID=51714 RepID=A0A8J4BPW2_9CHLO|nr:hypothetical protein Vafri_19567 [Volvox africanus]
MQLFQAHHVPHPSLEALFSFVHLDSATRKAAPVPTMLPGSPADVDFFCQRQAVADARRTARQQAQQHQQGSGGGEPYTGAVDADAREWIREARRLQELPALAPTDAVLMPSTCQHNTFICQPQHRNTSCRVFGGFLMRRAYELAFATTYMFGGVRPAFHKVEEITFTRPVDVGDLLRLTSTVVHASHMPEQQELVRSSDGQFHVTKYFGRCAIGYKLNIPSCFYILGNILSVQCEVRCGLYRRAFHEPLGAL